MHNGILECRLYIMFFSLQSYLHRLLAKEEGCGWGGAGGVWGVINWFVKGYRSVLRDSPNDILAGLMLAIIVVLELPPKLSFNNLKEK